MTDNVRPDRFHSNSSSWFVWQSSLQPEMEVVSIYFMQSPCTGREPDLTFSGWLTIQKGVDCFCLVVALTSTRRVNEQWGHSEGWISEWPCSFSEYLSFLTGGRLGLSTGFFARLRGRAFCFCRPHLCGAGGLFRFPVRSFICGS